MMSSELIEKYFLDGFTYQEIIKMLYFKDSIVISLRTLHRTLWTKELYCRGCPSPLVDVITFIENEISSSSCSIGYWAMHQRCTQNGYKVSKENVWVLVKAIDLIQMEWNFVKNKQLDVESTSQEDLVGDGILMDMIN